MTLGCDNTVFCCVSAQSQGCFSSLPVRQVVVNFKELFFKEFLPLVLCYRRNSLFSL